MGGPVCFPIPFFIGNLCFMQRFPFCVPAWRSLEAMLNNAVYIEPPAFGGTQGAGEG